MAGWVGEAALLAFRWHLGPVVTGSEERREGGLTMKVCWQGTQDWELFGLSTGRTGGS